MPVKKSKKNYSMSVREAALRQPFCRIALEQSRAMKYSSSKEVVEKVQVVHPGIKKSSPEGLDTILLYLQYLILVVLQFVEYVVHNGSISLNSV